MKYGFSDMKLHKVVAETIDGVKSVGLMEKLGMKREGVQRNQTRNNEGKTCICMDYFKMNFSR